MGRGLLAGRRVFTGAPLEVGSSEACARASFQRGTVVRMGDDRSDRDGRDERRSGAERRSEREQRSREGGPPDGVERRGGNDRRTGKDRREKM